MVFDNLTRVPGTQIIESQADEGSKLPTARNEEYMPQGTMDIQKPIKVLATAKKASNIIDQSTQKLQRPLLTTERFDISNSAHMDTAMKPVRLASGYSDDATPMSSTNLQPKGLQMMNNFNAITNQKQEDYKQATQFTVLTSHYQEQQLQLAQAQKLL